MRLNLANEIRWTKCPFLPGRCRWQGLLCNTRPRTLINPPTAVIDCRSHFLKPKVLRQFAPQASFDFVSGIRHLGAQSTGSGMSEPFSWVVQRIVYLTDCLFDEAKGNVFRQQRLTCQCYSAEGSQNFDPHGQPVIRISLP